MFDLGWTELLVIGIVALIVVGPKDLPGMFRTVGRFVGKAKGMARDFSRAMNDAADEAGVSDVQKTLNAAAKPLSTAMDQVKKTGQSFTESTMNSGKSRLSPERKAQADKIREHSAKAAKEKLAKEAADAADAGTPTKKKAAAGKAKPAAAKKPAAKKPAARKPASAKTAAKKPTSKPPGKPAPARKAAAKSTTSKARPRSKNTGGKAGDKA